MLTAYMEKRAFVKGFVYHLLCRIYQCADLPPPPPPPQNLGFFWGVPYIYIYRNVCVCVCACLCLCLFQIYILAHVLLKFSLKGAKRLCRIVSAG